MDSITRAELGETSPDNTVREHVSNIIWCYFYKHFVVTYAWILHEFIKHKNVKCAATILGFQDAKGRKARLIVTKNISMALSMFGKSRKCDVWFSHTEIAIVVVEPSTLRKQMVANNVEIDPCFEKNIAQAY